MVLLSFDESLDVHSLLPFEWSFSIHSSFAFIYTSIHTSLAPSRVSRSLLLAAIHYTPSVYSYVYNVYAVTLIAVSLVAFSLISAVFFFLFDHYIAIILIIIINVFFFLFTLSQLFSIVLLFDVYSTNFIFLRMYFIFEHAVFDVHIFYSFINFELSFDFDILTNLYCFSRFIVPAS